MYKDLNSKIKYMLELLFATISMFLLITISLYIPVIGMVFIPIPIVLLYLRHNKFTTILSIGTSLIIASVVFSSFLPLLFGVTYAIIGIILAICIKKNIKFIDTFYILSITVFIANTMSLVVNIYVVMKSTFWQFAQNTIANFNESIKGYSSLGGDASINQYMKSISKIMTPQNILSTLPTIIIIFSLIIAFLIYLMVEKVLIKNNYKINKITAFARWYFNPKLAAILIIIICLSMVINSKNILIAEYIYKMSYTLLQFILLIIGLAVINYFLENKMKFNKKFCIGISIIILISPLNVMLAIIGLIDLVADIRGIDSNSLGTALRKKLSL